MVQAQTLINLSPLVSRSRHGCIAEEPQAIEQIMVIFPSLHLEVKEQTHIFPNFLPRWLPFFFF